MFQGHASVPVSFMRSGIIEQWDSGPWYSSYQSTSQHCTYNHPQTPSWGQSYSNWKKEWEFHHNQHPKDLTELSALPQRNQPTPALLSPPWHQWVLLMSLHTLLYEINTVHEAGVCQNSRPI
ncbi:hypothetical protein Baya_0113 [Bagarius yarrelli]|uniref:Uncharacterized protein n=1 Tax=Bagarius yarrelli TaxID=175774 RepID=A0A556THC8_BAGYA|nr:hypothetical protein Baya_0113 [Bagarius yarrelli]